MKFIILFFSFINISIADPSPAKIIKAENSACRIESSSGEYPTYKVYKKEKLIFAPESDGIVEGKISPSGKYIALGGSEVNFIDLEKDKYEWGLVIINCETLKKKGYLKHQPVLIHSWEKEEEIKIDGRTINLKDQLP